MKTLALTLLFAVSTTGTVRNARAQEAPKAQVSSQEADFLQRAAESSIFIYAPSVDPCGPPPPLPRVIAPSGSGFVVGITNKKLSTATLWNGWRFLITAKHVLANQSQIIIRLNMQHALKSACFPLTLQTQGQGQNVFSADDGVDIVAIALPELSGTDPTVFGFSYLLDATKMKESEIGVGTQVFTVGYLLGYSGQKANFPVTKFGEISVITDEAWYLNPDSGLVEQGYIMELPNAPGLSGAPVLTHGTEFQTNPFRYRQLPPFVVEVVKGLMLAPVNGQLISQGVAVVEPSSNLKALLVKISAILKAGGGDPELN